jgi:hypothetical protein
MNNVVPLPGVPVPAPPKNPPCEWYGDRPAELYEIEPPIHANVDGARVVKKRAVMAYACRAHRERFDQRKAETAHRRAVERARKRAG